MTASLIMPETILICFPVPSESVDAAVREFPQFPVALDYDAMRAHFEQAATAS